MEMFHWNKSRFCIREKKTLLDCKQGTGENGRDLGSFAARWWQYGYSCARRCSGRHSSQTNAHFSG